MAKKETKSVPAGFGVSSFGPAGATDGLNIIEVAEPTFTTTAFTIVYNGDKRYSVVAVGVNDQTGESGNVRVVEGNLDIYECQNAFRKHVINAGLFDRGVDKE